jgi:hypothetical protein
MRNLAVLVLVTVGAGAVGAAWYARHGGASWQAVVDREQRRGAQLDATLERCHAFNQFFEICLAEVVAGRMRLTEACRAIKDYAARHYPRYLENIDRMLPGRSIHEKLARQLADWLQTPSAFSRRHRADRRFPERLQRELAEALTQGEELTSDH